MGNDLMKLAPVQTIITKPLKQPPVDEEVELVEPLLDEDEDEEDPEERVFEPDTDGVVPSVPPQ